MDNEIKAVQEFLSNYVTPFFGNRLRPNVLEQLVLDAEVLNIDADPHPYAPVEVDESKIKRIKDQQQSDLDHQGNNTNNIPLKAVGQAVDLN